MKIHNLPAVVGILLGASLGLNAAAPISATNTFAVGMGIPDGDATGLAVPANFVSGVGTMTKVRVRVNVTGTWNGDLFCYMAKGSKVTTLLNRAGRRAGDNFGYGDPGLNVAFDDAAANGDVHIYRLPLKGSHTTPLGTALTGEWTPDGRAVDPTNVIDTTPRTQTLSTFDGDQANGEWVLFIADMELGDLHVLQSWSLEITGNPLPTIVTQPVSQVVEASHPVTFSVLATNDLPISYQWQRNGVNIAGATNTSFSISATILADAGAYRVVVSNDNGPAYSQTVSLGVTDATPPLFVQCAPDVLLATDYVGQPDPVTQEVALPNFLGNAVVTDNAFTLADIVLTQNPPAGTIISSALQVVFTATDKSNNVAHCTNTVTINKRPVSYGTTTPLDATEDTWLTYPLLAADAETAAPALTYTIVALPTNGILYGVDGNGVVTNRPVVAVQYLPNTNWHGLDSFSFVADDGRATSLVAVVELNVTNVYDAPYTPDWQTNQVAEGALLPIPLVASSGDSLTLTLAITRPPQFGTVTLINGVATYQPNPGFNGVDTFEYSATDTLNGTSTGQIRIEVQIVADVLPYAFTNALAVGVGTGPRAVVALDFLKDYKLDLAVANANNNTVSLLRGLGDGNFTNVYQLAVGSRPIALAIGDYNYDRRPDLAVLCAGDQKVQIFLNNGALGTSDPATAFTGPTDIALSGNNPVALLAADLNKDLYPDLAVVDGGDGVNPGTVEVFMHLKFATAPVFDVTNILAVGLSPSAIAAGPLSIATAKPELVVANAGDNNVSVFKNVGNGLYALATNYPVGDMPMDVVVADINGDKKLDIIIANMLSDDVTVITNKGALQLVAAPSYGVHTSLGLGPRALAVGNYVKANPTEAKLDVAVVLQEAGQPLGHVAVLRGAGTNSLNGTTPVLEFFWFDPGAFFDVGAEPMAIVAGDFNGDKLTDLAVANSLSDDVSVLLNNWAPKAYNQKLTVVEDYPTNIVLGGNLGPLNYILTVLPTNGTITPSNNADLVNLTTNPVLYYEPFSNRFGRDLIKYYVDDGTKTSKWATLSITVLAVNDPPSFSNAVGELGVIEVPEDSIIKRTNFVTYVWPGPWGEEKQRLTYYFKPADLTLFKGLAGRPKIVGTNLVLWLTPTNNVFGETLVEMWAKDSGRVKTNKPNLLPYGEWDTSPTQTFIVRITNVNDAPKFLKTTQLTAKSVLEDGQTNWMFDIYDIDSPMDSITVTATTTNTAVLDPNNPAQFNWTITDTSVPGTNKWTVTLNVIPAADAFGTVPLTIRLNDGTNSSSWNTTLRVLPVNDAPSFDLLGGVSTIARDTISGYGYTNAVVNLATVSKGPANESAQLLTYTIVNSNPTLFSVLPKVNPVTGELSFKAKAANGSATLDIYLTDSGGTLYGGVNKSAARTITVNVTFP